MPVRLLHSALGMTNELGEITSVLQKWLYYGKPFALDELRTRLKDEYGDLLWHLDQGLRALGLAMADVLAGNVAKLRVRYPERWTAALAEDGARDRAAEGRAVGGIKEGE